MQRSISSIVEEAEKLTDNPKKQAEFLTKHESHAFKEILTFAMDPDAKWLLPDTDPPYKAVEQGTDQEGRLYSEIDKLVYFTNTPEGLNVKSVRREQLFIQLLETVAPDDAKLLLRMRRKELKVMIWSLKEVYPQMTGHWK